VAHTCNPSYRRQRSEIRDQEDWCLKPAQATIHETLSGEIPSQKRAGGVAQGVNPQFKSQHHPPKKNLVFERHYYEEKEKRCRD
jgi:hypothetical protein